MFSAKPIDPARIACIADDSEVAQNALHSLRKAYDFIEPDMDDPPQVIIVLGGDGFMLHSLHEYMHLGVPFYGMNCGTVGFLLNQFREETLLERLMVARPSTHYPLKMFARCYGGGQHEKLAINEISLFRQTRQAANIRVTVDHVVRIPNMVGDGIMVSTPAGSTAYNYSAGGPIIPLEASLIALTPISPFRPRRWRGALLPEKASVYLEVLDPVKRPVSAVADYNEVRDVTSLSITQHRKHPITLLFDPEHHLEERLITEQFM